MTRREKQRVVWGVMLITIGVVLLLDQTGLLGLRSIGSWWPLAFFVIGIARMVMPACPRDVVVGLWFVGLGLWFFACEYHWLGLRYGTAWPLLLLLGGSSMVLRALLEHAYGRSREEDQPHA